ncbi:DUF6785 family protein [Candidatus Poribacteria bacterium]
MSSKSGKRSITLRSLLFGLLAILVNCYWTTVAEVKYSMGDASTLPLFVYPIFILFAVTGLNLLWKRFLPKSSLCPGELLVIYIMAVVSSTFLGESMIAGMFGSITYPFRYATLENEWNELFLKYIPSWLTVKDEKVLEGFYRGGSSLYFTDNLRAWSIPLIAWGAFTFVLAFIMLCFSVILRKQWGEREILAFPIIQLPLRMTDDKGVYRFFGSKVMWIGFAVPLVIDLVNGLGSIYPAMPSIRWIKYQWGFFGRYFTEKPWNALAGEGISLYPFAIGLGFFLPVDLLFSCWFFYLIRMAERIIGSLAGWRSLPSFPYFDEQGSGAWVGLCFIALFSSRRYLREVSRCAMGRRSELDDANEPIRYRTALLGILGGMIFLLIFCYRMGMSLWLTFVFFMLFYIISIAITRVRAELGSMHEILFVNPRNLLVRFVGTRSLGQRSLTVMSFISWFNFSQSCHPMPGQLEAFKMGENRGLRGKGLFYILTIATVVSIIACFWFILDLLYKSGANSEVLGLPQFVGDHNFRPLETWLNNPVKPDAVGMTFTGIGFFTVVFLMFMRTRFFWWPFHPAGYTLAVSFAMDYFWFAFLATWIAKSIILKVGGIRLHRQAIPFFLGLILGDYVMGSVWAIVGPVIGRSVYSIFI